MLTIATINEATQVHHNDSNSKTLSGKCGFIDIFMTCAEYPDQEANRIVGGDDAKFNEFPWQVKLVRYGSLVCGGTLLCEKFVVSAAHCITYENSAEPRSHEGFQIIVGDHQQTLKDSGEVNHEIQKWIVHPSYSSDPKYFYDIAIIELKEPVKINKHVNTACLPFLEPNDDSTVLISGWGKTQYPDGPPADILQKASLNVISRKECQDMYAKPYLGKTGEITDQMICAARKGKDACQGDSGGMKSSSCYEIHHYSYIVTFLYTSQKRSNGQQH